MIQISRVQGAIPLSSTSFRFSDPNGNKVYFTKSDGLYSYRIQDQSEEKLIDLEKTIKTKVYMPASILRDQGDQKVLIGMLHRGHIFEYNVKTRVATIRKWVEPRNPTLISELAAGPDGRIYLSGSISFASTFQLFISFVNSPNFFRFKPQYYKYR